MEDLEYSVSLVIKYFNGRLRLSESTIELNGDLNDAEKVAMEAVIQGLKEDAEEEDLDHWSEGIQEIKVSVRLK